jgi:hypothetical protein
MDYDDEDKGPGNFGTDLTPVSSSRAIEECFEEKRTSRNDGNFSSTSKKQSCFSWRCWCRKTAIVELFATKKLSTI